MPYTTDSKNLPSYVKNKPQNIKKKWVEIFNSLYKEKGEEAAFIGANGWLKREMKKKSRLVKRSFVPFEVDTSQGFIKRSNDGEEYISFVLNSNKPHKDGKVFSEDMLKKWAEKINEGANIIGDVDHEYYDDVLKNMPDDMIPDAIKEKPGIAKTIKAIYDKGKLWVKAMIDKRYKKLIEKSKGVSVEALCSWDDEVATEGDILGFTFNVDTEPADTLARVYE